MYLIFEMFNVPADNLASNRVIKKIITQPMKIKINLFLIFFLNCLQFIGAQEVVKLSLNNNGNYTLTKIPFDKPFTLSIPYSSDIIDISYKLKDKSGVKWHYMSQDTSGEVTNNFPNQPFNLEIGPLHANTRYLLDLTAKTKPQFTEDEELKNKLIVVMRKHLENNDDIGEKVQKKLKLELIDTFYKALGNKGKNLKNRQGNSIDFAPYSKQFTTTTNKIIETNDEIRDLSKNLKGELHELEEGIDDMKWESVRKKLFELSKDTSKIDLDFDSKVILLEKVSPSLKSFATLTISDASKILWKLTLEKDKIGKILTGKWKLEGKTDLPTSMFDESSFQFIYASLQILKESKLKKVNSDSYFTDTEEKEIQYRLEEIDSIMVKKQKLKIANEKRARQINLFPDLLYDSFKEIPLRVPLIPSVEMNARDSPYFGVDLGVGYAFKLKRAVTYQGLNFHITPVDKSLPIRTYKSLDIPMKLISIFIGVTQILNPDEESYTKFADFGNPTIGAGFRFSNIFRLNVGGMWLKAKDIDPIVTKTTDKFTPTISLSVDIALQDLIKGATGFIK